MSMAYEFEFQSTLSVRRATTRALKVNPRELFQSTLSVRRATRFPSPIARRWFNFNLRSPWGERLDIQEHCSVIIGISIHALREESDSHNRVLIAYTRIFQSTLSVRRATQIAVLSMPFSVAFQSTLSARRATVPSTYTKRHCGRFQSTLSVRRATITATSVQRRYQISIHALREESDIHQY